MKYRAPFVVGSPAGAGFQPPARIIVRCLRVSAGARDYHGLRVERDGAESARGLERSFHDLRGRAELGVIVGHAQEETRELAFEEVPESQRGSFVLAVHAPHIAAEPHDCPSGTGTSGRHFDDIQSENAVQSEWPQFAQWVAGKGEAFEIQLF